jgi:N-methylhydantoinase A
LAEKAVATIAKRLRMPLERTAAGILQIVVSAMVRAVRVISVEKGEDPRDFALMAFGGAGALHATAVAKQLGIKTVFVPPAPGLLCSMGALLAAPTMEYSRTKVLGADRAAEIDRIFSGLSAQARQWLASERVPLEARQLRCSIDMRYVGQNHELTVALPAQRIRRKGLDQAVEGFHQEHKKQFGYSSPEDPVQVVSCRVVATGVATRIESRPQPLRADKPRPRETRPVYFEGEGRWVDCPVYWRGDIAPGATLAGPAVVEQLDATTVLYPRDAARVDAYGNILIAVGLDPVEVK